MLDGATPPCITPRQHAVGASCSYASAAAAWRGNNIADIIFHRHSRLARTLLEQQLRQRKRQLSHLQYTFL